MMKIFKALGVALSLFCIMAVAQALSLPDSLVTSDNVYRFMFSDTKRAEAIMAALREKGKMPEWELDYTEGDLYYNTGRNYRALKLYSKALASKAARNDHALHMDLLHRMISCYDMMHNESRKAECVKRLLEEAKTCGDKAMQAVALFNMGKSEYNQGDHNGGCRRMEQAARMMATTDYEYKYDNLRYHYNTLLTYYEHDRRGEDALRVLRELEKVATAATGKEKAGIEGLDDKERKAFLGHRAVVMNLLGRQREADESYRQFQKIGKPTDRDQYIIMPYLFDRKMYGEVIRINLQRERQLREEGDTVNYHFTTIRKDLAQAYFALGDYRRAAVNFEALSVLRDSIKNREQQSSALELAEAYDSAEKDKTIMEQKVHKIVLASVGCAAVIALAFFVGYSRKLRQRNVSLVKAVKEGLVAKEELLLMEQECKALMEKTEGQARRIGDLLMREKEGGHHRAPACNDKEAREAELLERAKNMVCDRQLYLQSGLTQNVVADEVGVSSGRLGDIFKRHTGDSFSEYINRLRMEHATKMLIDHPEYTIEAVAKMSGIDSKQHFHRQFLKFAGLTPSAFRRANEKADNE